jgi:hypothetical protein
MNTKRNRQTAGKNSPSGDVMPEHNSPDGRSPDHSATGGAAPATGATPDHSATDGPGPATGEHPAIPEDAVARRTPTGWRVGGEELPDLTSAMVFADLLAAELPSEEEWQASGGAATGPAVMAGQTAASQRAAGAIVPSAESRGPGSRSADAPRASSAGAVKGNAGKRRAVRPGLGAERPAGEAEQLKETVAQLERALTVRVRVEQAIGVLAERHKLRPRQAFELLRSAARARGARVSQTAGEVVASATNPLLRIPEELAKQPEARRTSRHTRRKP